MTAAAPPRSVREPRIPALTAADGPIARPGGGAAEMAAERDRTEDGRARRRRFSSLTLRILAPNMLALGVLVGGVFLLDQYRDGLIDQKIAALQTQAEVIAGALEESALDGPPEGRRIDPRTAQRLLRRLVEPGSVRARLFAPSGELLADSRDLIAAGRQVQLRYLPPPGDSDPLQRTAARLYDWLLPRLPQDRDFPPYHERLLQRAEDYGEVMQALNGDIGGEIRALGSGLNSGLMLSVASPVQPLRQVLGGLMLSASDGDIEERVRDVRIAIIQAFLTALMVTVLLSLFLAQTIARPVRRLAHAADRVRHAGSASEAIPDLSARADEIGDLSIALRAMTEAQHARLSAIESFAADVAHEIKNPLSSLRSAVESLQRTDDPSTRDRLLGVVDEDVVRLDRLISDISNASRLDAELLRADTDPVDLAGLVATVGEIYRSRLEAGQPRVEVSVAQGRPLIVDGLDSRLGQVMHNLVDNALSFSPPDGVVLLSVAAEGAEAVIRVEDEGPGVPASEREAVFRRFYSRRPEDEAFGLHSGLGLSIVRQIVEAHGGRIRIVERLLDGFPVTGACFEARLPLARKTGG